MDPNVAWLQVRPWGRCRAVGEMDAREDRNEEMLKTHCIGATTERESGPW